MSKPKKLTATPAAPGYQSLVAQVPIDGPLPPTIVSEVSVAYLHGRNVDEEKGPLCKRFEMVIEVNRKRGYVLDTWRLTSAAAVDNGVCTMNETIIAVFKKKGWNDPNA